jgi:glutathione S-transferase
MNYQLYDGLQTGGAVVRAILAEIGVPFNVVTTDIRTGVQKSDAFSAVNPRQQVPALLFPDGQIMTETSAIIVQLADLHPDSRLLPPLGSAQRGQALRWLSFCATNLYEGESRKLNPGRYTTGDPEGVRMAAREFIDRNYLVLEGAFGQGPYLGGDQISVTDIYIWMLAQWHHDFDWLEEKCGKVVRCIRLVMDRPAIRKVHDDQFGPGLGLKPLPPPA